jgi:hypothetical protein
MMLKACGLFLSLFLVLNVRAATFSLTPNVVSNDYTGLISFQMTGLTAGETVQMQQFYDANSNGVVDAGEICVRSEVVTDGQATLFNGVTNINLFRDEDGAANGTIISSIHFTAAPDIARGIASYIFRFSSPSNNFTTTNLTFAVRSPPYAQGVQGTVISDSTNVPNAYVALVQNSGGNVQIVIAGTTADTNGNYSLKALPGIYQVLAFQTGYVGNLTNFPTVTLLTNTTVTTNLTLIAATTTISGSLVDSTNVLVKAIPNAQLIAFSTNLLVAVSEADSNANFSIPVSANNVWTVRATAQSAATEAYLVPDASIESHYETFSGPVSNAIVMLKHATAIINGRTVDKFGNSVPGVSLAANADFGQYNAFALSDSNGLYSMAIDAGQGTVDVQNPANPPANNFIWPTPQFYINSGQVVSLNVTGLVVTARFRSHVVADTGTPLSGLNSVADSYQFYGAYTFATTDNNGFLDMPVFGDEWAFGWLSTLPPNLVFPDVPPFTITDGVNLTNDIVARTVTGTVSGYVHDANSRGITNLTVIVTNSVGVTNFTLRAVTDTNGNYSVAVFSGTWNVSPDNNALEIKGYIPVNPTNVTVPPSNMVANFIVSSVPPPQIITTNFFDAIISNYYSAGLDVTNGSYPTLWSLVSGALPDGLTLNPFGYISGDPTNLGLFSFTVKVQDSRGSNDVRTLSIQVDPVPTGPPQILTTSLADAAVGCSYATQLQATNGTLPYSWALAIGSDPMPPGLNLATNGIISGTPQADGYFTIQVQVTGGDGSATNSMVQIVVNTALQIYPYPLPAGDVGSSYFGSLNVSGGAQPQTWSVISGSLPPNLVIDPATGYITGTPAAVGISSFTLRVTDGCNTIDTPVSITNYPALRITTTTLPVAPLNVPYTNQLAAAGGLPPYTWYPNGAMPNGLTLNPDGSIVGTPYLEGTNDVSVQLYDSLGNGTNRDLTLIVTSKPVLDLPTHSTSQQFTFRITGVPGQDYTLQSASDLSNWTDLFITNAPASIFYLTDTNATGPHRFYRLKVNP